MPDPKDEVFGQLVVEMGHATPDQISECLRNQEVMATMGIRHSLDEVLVAKGILTAEARRELLREIQRRSGEHPADEVGTSGGFRSGQP